VRWMSPELFDSEGHQRTKGSDCYALGMVIYEVLSRRIPFYQYKNFAIVGRVIKGERPERPQGPEGVGGFTDAVWEVLGLCWKSLPQERPSIEDVLKCMKKAATSWTPPSPPSTAVPSVVGSPTSDTSVIASEESEDADKGGVPPPNVNLQVFSPIILDSHLSDDTITLPCRLPCRTCLACGKPIHRAFVRAFGTVFHLNCFNCMVSLLHTFYHHFGIQLCPFTSGLWGHGSLQVLPHRRPRWKATPTMRTDRFRHLNLICAKCGMALRGSYVTACSTPISNPLFH
jgi:hypothetical protein